MWPPGATKGPLVKLTNPDKVLYPATDGVGPTTKADVFGYYTSIAEVMLPHLAGRPATRKRWPDGVAEPSFFEKDLPKYAPDWLVRGTLVHRSGAAFYPIIDTATALAWIAQQAALEVHVPQWRFGPDGRPVDRADVRLVEVLERLRDAVHGETQRVATLAGVEVGQQDAVLAPRRAEVGTGAEGTARAGDDDHADLVVVLRAADGIGPLGQHVLAERVHPLRAVQRDRRDALTDVVFDLRVIHVSPFSSAASLARAWRARPVPNWRGTRREARGPGAERAGNPGMRSKTMR